jgi:hypothetical protein
LWRIIITITTLLFPTREEFKKENNDLQTRGAEEKKQD